VRRRIAEAARPDRLGVSVVEGGVTVAVASRHAEAIDVCLFEPSGSTEVERIRLAHHTDGVWHGFIDGVAPGALYGLRADGPYQPERGQRFNHHKLLVDPYARLLHGGLRWSDAVYGYRVGDPAGDLSFDDRDSAPFVPKCVVVPDQPRLALGPSTPLAESLIYEAHVRGMTMRHPGVPDAARGTFAGLATPVIIDHLRALGVTAIELLPIHAFVSEPFLVSQGRTNYWGYNTLAFFAPHAPYLGAADREGFRVMVQAFHDAGIQVILDVVYNHTAEGNELGPTLSLRGLDNATYYRLDPENPRHYVNWAGTGNTVDVSDPVGLRLVMDSLRYWAGEMGVDGFRFDLATVLARREEDFDSGSAFLAAVAQDPLLATRTMIAEPWDVGPGGYRLGGFPPGWSEWNDRFRDGVRRFWRGDPGTRAEFASRMSGSSDITGHAGRAATASVNFLTSHDGMTLRDLVSFAEKHNESNGEDNRDGHSEDYSANYGHEGPTDDPGILAMRARQQRNLLATLFVSHGVPMLLAGDELGHSQEGNNNAYSQDNATTWIDWAAADGDLLAFTRELAALRHELPALRTPEHLHEPELTWVAPTGEPMTGAEWDQPDARAMTMLVDPDDGDTVAICLNAADTPVAFSLPGDRRWTLRCTTAPGQWAANRWDAPGRSLAVFTSSDA
jgi:isoamylase